MPFESFFENIDGNVRLREGVTLTLTSGVGAAASTADGGTITHGYAAAPTAVVVSGSVAGEIVTVTSIGTTTFTVAIKTNLGEAGTTQTIYWMAMI